MSSLEILTNVNAERLRRIVIVVELIWFVLVGVAYFQFGEAIFIFLPFLFVVHLLTILALPSVFKKLNADEKEELLYCGNVEDEQSALREIDLWDRVAVGFYVLSNVLLQGVLLITFFF